MATTAAAVRERPILFSGPMVRAILEGRKTQTRRVVAGSLPLVEDVRKLSGAEYRWMRCDDLGWPQDHRAIGPVWAVRDLGGPTALRCPHGQPGDRLWIRAGYLTRFDIRRNTTSWTLAGTARSFTTHGPAQSKSGKPKRDGKHPGRFMPNWLSQEFRLPLLEITDIRLEPLQEITPAAILAEGVIPKMQTYDVAIAEWQRTWDAINADRGYGWDQNPWVWVLSFRRVEEGRA